MLCRLPRYTYLGTTSTLALQKKPITGGEGRSSLFPQDQMQKERMANLGKVKHTFLPFEWALFPISPYLCRLRIHRSSVSVSSLLGPSVLDRAAHTSRRLWEEETIKGESEDLLCPKDGFQIQKAQLSTCSTCLLG